MTMTVPNSAPAVNFLQELELKSTCSLQGSGSAPVILIEVNDSVDASPI